MIGALLEGLPEPAWLVDGESLTVSAVNRAALRLLGLKPERALGQPPASLCGSLEDEAFWQGAARDPFARIRSDTVLTHSDGQPRWVSRSISPVHTPDGGRYWLVLLHDQTRRRRAEAERETLLAELRATLESTADGILVVDLAGRVRSFNRRFAKLWGLPGGLLHEPGDAGLWLSLQRVMRDGEQYRLRIEALLDAPLMRSSDMLRLADGRVLEQVSLPQMSRGEPIGRVFSFRDLSEKLAAHQRIEELGRSDALTGAPNRRALADRIVQLMSAVATGEPLPSFALLHLDLDRFKQINDTLGHSYGDRVLREIVERLRGAVGANDTLARLGGDEFALLIDGAQMFEAEAAARRVQQLLAQPFTFDTLSFTVTASCGIALFPGDGGSPDDLMASAERAMHWVKESGRAGFRFHVPRKEVDLLSRMRLDHDMRQALAEGRFRLHYQPQVELGSDRVIGAEALIRWRDPQRGDISPAEFIPLAEESGFVVAIGDWVLREAVEQAAYWLGRGLRMPVAVNVSALQFQQARFVENVAAALRDAALPASMLELELTEGVLIGDADEGLKRMQALAALGVTLSIDDFGTGYSSLAYLKRFPIQRLKIDRSFVKGLPNDASDCGIANAIVQMGRALGLQVIAEGVETEAQRDFLAQAGCHEFQGYLYAPALRPEEFEQRVRPRRHVVDTAVSGWLGLAGNG
ncbi:MULTISPECIES: bifunctional diguanylate cyclase/phosphodiesterase [Roseateles]|uniref:Diguanylate cyclase (GGDEF)-like protein/PAS domain S-box-containing protein n=1 Tax=Pelomonas aquatica TaxID=431058 RepID=A0ABU1ZC60_9BURK|nr:MULTISPECIES: bifunctional diguanylate cyclase/phosphodiesterase [Roseateles]MDR7298211.1 diguanylate cyclase (GGDEF)-like protein/PAS domain S-box-containing protein [Pelomonas aquatica]